MAVDEAPDEPQEKPKATKAGAVDEFTEQGELAKIERDNPEAEPEGEPGELVEAEAEGPETAELLAALFNPLFAVLAPNWEVQPAECEALAGAYATVIDKWFPDAASNTGPELAAALVTVAVIQPRIGKPRRVPVEGEQETADQKPAKAAAATKPQVRNGVELLPVEGE